MITSFLIYCALSYPLWYLTVMRGKHGILGLLLFPFAPALLPIALLHRLFST